MTILGLFLFGLACVGFASEALDAPEADRASESKAGGLEAILFLLCLASVVRSHKKTDDEEF